MTFWIPEEYHPLTNRELEIIKLTYQEAKAAGYFDGLMACASFYEEEKG